MTMLNNIPCNYLHHYHYHHLFYSYYFLPVRFHFTNVWLCQYYHRSKQSTTRNRYRSFHVSPFGTLLPVIFYCAITFPCRSNIPHKPISNKQRICHNLYFLNQQHIIQFLFLLSSNARTCAIWSTQIHFSSMEEDKCVCEGLQYRPHVFAAFSLQLDNVLAFRAIMHKLFVSGLRCACLTAQRKGAITH